MTGPYTITVTGTGASQTPAAGDVDAIGRQLVAALLAAGATVTKANCEVSATVVEIDLTKPAGP